MKRDISYLVTLLLPPKPDLETINDVGGNHFGVGKDLQVGSRRSGLLDAVRIYDRVVGP